MTAPNVLMALWAACRYNGMTQKEAEGFINRVGWEDVGRCADSKKMIEELALVGYAEAVMKRLS